MGRPGEAEAGVSAARVVRAHLPGVWRNVGVAVADYAAMPWLPVEWRRVCRHVERRRRTAETRAAEMAISLERHLATLRKQPKAVQEAAAERSGWRHGGRPRTRASEADERVRIRLVTARLDRPEEPELPA